MLFVSCLRRHHRLQNLAFKLIILFINYINKIPSNDVHTFIMLNQNVQEVQYTKNTIVFTINA